MQIEQALAFIEANARQHAGKLPTLGTLLEEVAELTRAVEGKHEHPPALELVQLGGIVANMLRAFTFEQTRAALRDRYGAEDSEGGT